MNLGIDNLLYDNWNNKGNINPWTGKKGNKDPDNNSLFK
jgi:hypothetical protein